MNYLFVINSSTFFLPVGFCWSSSSNNDSTDFKLILNPPSPPPHQPTSYAFTFLPMSPFYLACPPFPLLFLTLFYPNPTVNNISYSIPGDSSSLISDSSLLGVDSKSELIKIVFRALLSYRLNELQKLNCFKTKLTCPKKTQQVKVEPQWKRCSVRRSQTQKEFNLDAW